MITYKRLAQIAAVFLFLASSILIYMNSDAARMCVALSENTFAADESAHLSNRSDFQLPIIFIGGIPRSGTTLMRVMLDAHPDIRCGPETRIIPALLIQRRQWVKTKQDIRLLKDAGVLPTALDLAVASFILEAIKHHAPSAANYCNKDPFVLADMKYIKGLFPRAKFIFMIRDGRATAHSIVSKKVVISKLDIKSYRAVLQMWNNISRIINTQCVQLGEKVCLPIKYESLVLRPIETTKRIFKFLEIPWLQEVIHHHQYLNRTRLSKYERSTDQVVRPIYLDALYSWVGHIPVDVEENLSSIAPMLTEFGYNPSVRKPFYGYPEGHE